MFDMQSRNPSSSDLFPVLVSWIGDTELKVMGREEVSPEPADRMVAERIFSADKGYSPKATQEQFKQLNLEKAYSSLLLILGDDGPRGFTSASRTPDPFPQFRRLVLLSSRKVPETLLNDFEPRYRSFLWRRINRKPDAVRIDIHRCAVDIWDYDSVYRETVRVLKEVEGDGIDWKDVYFNLTPGTVTQEITLALIGKERRPANFIQVVKNDRRVMVCDIPWDLTLVRRADDEAISRIFDTTAQNLFPDTEEGRSERSRLATIAALDVDCLLTGETGVGKNRIAETIIQELSSRKGKPFVSFNCAALGGDTNMLRSQLFGAKKGSFTGAVDDITGLAAEANGGILFLDEVECLSPEAQGILLDFIQPKEGAKTRCKRTYKPIGEKPRTTDVRIISATNRNLWRMVEEKKFREDLYWRLAPLTFHVPSIRERMASGIRVGGKTVVAHMACQFLAEFCKELDRKAEFSPEALAFLEKQEWPGNVRHLRNVVLRALVFASAGGVIGVDTIQRELQEDERWDGAGTAQQTDETGLLPTAAPAAPDEQSTKPPAMPPTPPPSEEIDGLPACREGETLGDAIDREVKSLRARYTRAAVAKYRTQSAAAEQLGVRRVTISKWIHQQS